ncbi:HisF protein [Buchnera aphidicola str. Bp (Baizongia pistaciae)]|uniref:Imidazole glycerol phosphate synthase subunit HisF n=1 Tax=Buchnera aphidicola subsp. Baizongia pistaciae (strain Bp) TaxID=224915 RepID=HIS6_BUCBP|nr:imidazole glycerol phosphate synthase subunit HisF [Buchnera aphidicola]P59521.1 RecName: Full=Imidazole glycerol phosphate synthase subunit HisF; AltName: Full=IGP synthase cyclase subunit; AltName: Full=IGP synthase subunit HisF; AltName: Full=ImGP synthase subunit HisF; Short=IGPS subunit HisF [Buchnera aphidicola str. Bp (Baizongia pistaciae)]AAO26834.1 HisF protein [Buchnera aphidicola str. Bp (Baizongia pistaciae)]
MLAKRIIPCLDVKSGIVVKGVQFRNHEIVGGILSLAKRYTQEGADELVFYDIEASSNNRLIKKKWVSQIAEIINIPFCVAGGIQTIQDVQSILSSGADKISINSPAISDPYLISRIADRFGVQCVVVGIDSWFNKEESQYYVYQYTGDNTKTIKTSWKTCDWVQKVQALGAGEIVLNVMNQDGMKNGYDLVQLKKIRKICNVPLIASGGAGDYFHFYDVFNEAKVDGALAASVFHNRIIKINQLKKFLMKKGLEIRVC